jgi:hypothetical protein
MIKTTKKLRIETTTSKIESGHDDHHYIAELCAKTDDQKETNRDYMTLTE